MPILLDDLPPSHPARRGRSRRHRPVECPACGEWFIGRSDAIWCSKACRTWAWRLRKQHGDEAILALLEDVGRAGFNAGAYSDDFRV
jgi:hypothetical protein